MSTEPETILIVEDGPDLGVLLQELVEDMNRRAVLATTGSEAIDVLSRKPVRLLLLDFELSDMSAEELLQRLRATGKAIPPVVLMSGRHRASVGLCWPELVEVLKKPFELSQLSDLLERRLPRS